MYQLFFVPISLTITVMNIIPLIPNVFIQLQNPHRKMLKNVFENACSINI